MTSKELINHILSFCSEKWYSDIHIVTNEKIKIRNNSWEIEDLEKIIINDKELKIPPMTLENIKSIIYVLAWEIGYEKFRLNLELDTSYAIEDETRYRVNIYSDTNWFSIALRAIPKDIPSLDDLWLWEQVKKMASYSKWLILVTGPTWSWKSTNLAAIIDYINSNFKKHIITIEDPVEFSFKNKLSLINQRELWANTKSFSNAIRSALREDPDIVMLWEMRDPETIKAAITLAETGHLVLSTLHTNDSVQTVDRIVDIFPSSQQKQIRMQLAMSLVWIISQKLLPRKDKDGKIAAREILVANDPVRNLIITWKTHQLYSVLEVGKDEWMILMDKYLMVLYKKWLITKEVLLSYARDKENIEMIINNN